MSDQQRPFLLRAAGLFFGGVAALFLLAAYVPPLMDWMTVGDDEVGEAYRITKVKHFKEPIPEAPPPLPDRDKIAVNDARVYTIGDSFTWLELGYRDFSSQLQSHLQEPVFYLGHSAYANPFYDMKYNHLDTSTRRVLVYQKIESYALTSYSKDYDNDPPERVGGRYLGKYSEPIRSGLRWTFEDVEDRLQYLLEYNHVAFQIASLYNTYRFDQFGDIDEWAGMTLNTREVFKKYSIDHGSTYGSTGIFTPITDARIEEAADNMASVRKVLLDKYNVEIVLLIVPNKATTFLDALDAEYNNLIPRLEEALEDRGVPYVSLFEEFQGRGDKLYYRSDPHWNAQGREIALWKVGQKVDSLLAQDSNAVSD